MQQQGTSNTTTDRNTIGEKELLYVKDFLSWELLAMKKCNELANSVQDEQMKQLIRDTGKKHQQHYETLLTHLQS